MVTLHPFWVERDRQQAEQTELLNQAKDIFMAIFGHNRISGKGLRGIQ